MKVSDIVDLLEDDENLRAKNIYKGMSGILVSYISLTDEWIVQFLDDHNYGAYAVAKVKAKNLKFSSEMYEKWAAEFLETIKDPQFYTHTELKLPKFKEYDKVMLIKDKPRYKIEGLKKGMIGCVVSTHAIRNEWEVIFSEEGTARDIADIDVHEDDLQLVD